MFILIIKCYSLVFAQVQVIQRARLLTNHGGIAVLCNIVEVMAFILSLNFPSSSNLLVKEFATLTHRRDLSKFLTCFLQLTILMGFVLPECQGSARGCLFYGTVYLAFINNAGRKHSIFIKKRWIKLTSMPTQRLAMLCFRYRRRNVYETFQITPLDL